MPPGGKNGFIKPMCLTMYYTLAFSEPAILMCFHHIFDLFGYPGITDREIISTIGMALLDAIAKLSVKPTKKTSADADEFHKKAARS
jgi:hypothetical protein